MILMGDSGRGKTYFLLTLIKELLETRDLPLAALRYINAADLEERVDAEVQQFRTARNFISSLCDVSLLFIDDFGVEKTLERAERNYYTITDKRLSYKRPTVFSTNLTNDEIFETYGPRIDSRLKHCERLYFTGHDMRNPQPMTREKYGKVTAN